MNLRLAGWRNRRRIRRLARQVQEFARPDPALPRVVMFNASARLTGLSLNAAFSALTAWGLRLGGVEVHQFVCQAGLRPCVLGTSRADYTTPPPCSACLAQSRRMYQGANAAWFRYQPDAGLEAALQDLDVEQLGSFEFADPTEPLGETIPLGRLALPSVRWALRRHHLPDDVPQGGSVNDANSSRYLLRQYMLSALSLNRQFGAFLDRVRPGVVVIFNGSLYPEAAARWTALQRGYRVVTHEVGFQRLSTFFTNGEATAYPIEVPGGGLELNPAQSARLDAYLQARFQGNFTMAGIRFWPEMRGLDQAFLDKAATFRQMVPVFTNVVYDTSQVHANTLFPHMFAWLDLVAQSIRAHPETLFVVRAHPDELRVGTAKLSNESVHDWFYANGLDRLPNTVFIEPNEYISSYELIQRSKFVIVYNSSIGLEAALMGAAVVCGGKARYTQIPTVYLPPSPQALHERIENFLEDGLQAGLLEGAGPASQQPYRVPAPPEFRRNARQFIYHQLYRTSLPMDRFLEVGQRMGFVQLKDFPWQALTPQQSPTMRILLDGIVHNQPFLWPDDEA